MEPEQYSTSTGQRRPLHIADYAIFALTLACSVVIGFYFAVKDRRRQNTAEYLLAGRRMHVVPVAVSLSVTFMSALTLLGTPAEMYNYNTMYLWIVVALVFATAGSALLFIPFFYRLNLTSTFEYLEMRFNKAVRNVASVAFIIQMCTYMAFVLYTPSLALSAVTGFDLWKSVGAVGVVVSVYTAMGGMKAVLATDTFQAVLIFAGLLAVLIRGSIVNGGFVNAWNIAANRSRIVFDEFSPDPSVRHSVWSVAVGGAIYWSYLYGVNQAQVQRAISCPSVRKAQLALWLNLPLLWLIVGLSGFIGVVMFAFYSDCHPISFGVISKTDQLLPLFVLDILGSYPGLPGLFLACLFSGSLSTLSSGLNALAAVVMVDMVRPYCCKGMSDSRATVFTKLIVLMFGGVAIAVSYIVSLLGSVLQAAISVLGAMTGPIFGLFVLGMFFPCANSKGALVGGITSFTLLTWITIGAYLNDIRTPLSPTLSHACNWTAQGHNLSSATAATAALSSTTSLPAGELAASAESSGFLHQIYSLSYLHYSTLACFIVVIVGVIVSFITGPTRPSSLDPQLYCPLADILFPWLPARFRRALRFGVLDPEEYKNSQTHKEETVGIIDYPSPKTSSFCPE